MSATAPSVTPSDYHRVVSSTLRISEDPEIPVPVGILACQRDPLLRSLETTVVTAAAYQQTSAPSKNPRKKSVTVPAIQEPLLAVVLHDTVIFPEGGGQPTDTGLITTSLNGRSWRVTQARRHGGHAMHYIRVADGNVEEALLAFVPGTHVTVTLEKEDFDRRYDHMSMHTSQHLLSALLESRLDLPTLSWSLTSYPSACYIEVPRAMTPEEIASIQAEANTLVFEGRKVHIEAEELHKTQDRVPTLESGRAVGRGLPEDYTGGVKRVVVIDGVDRNPCCGTHLPSLHNLQLFLLPRSETPARPNTSTARQYFLSGPRLISHLTSTHHLLTTASGILSCGPLLVPDRVIQVVEERKKAEKRVEHVEAELAKTIGRDLAVGAKAAIYASTTYKKHSHRVDDSVNVLGFLSAISSAFLDEVSLDDQPYFVVLTSSPSSQTVSSMTVILVFGSDEKEVKQISNRFKEKIGVKGGGKGTKWSGKFNGVWGPKEGIMLNEIIDGL